MLQFLTQVWPACRDSGRAILASADFAQPALAATTLAMQNALVAAAQNATFRAAASNINLVDNFFLSNRTNRLTAFTPGLENFLDEGALGAYQGQHVLSEYMQRYSAHLTCMSGCFARCASFACCARLAACCPRFACCALPTIAAVTFSASFACCLHIFRGAYFSYSAR